MSTVLIATIIGAFIVGCTANNAPNSAASSSEQATTNTPENTVSSAQTEQSEPDAVAEGDRSTAETAPTDPSGFAEVTDVSASGEPGSYTFSVMVQSPDTGCDQYANWWEVLSEDGNLLYRRVLLHSHVNEQPFTRSGGPVAIQPTDVVIVRAHMVFNGYGTQAHKGTVADGFSAVELPERFAASVAQHDPQPPDCNF